MLARRAAAEVIAGDEDRRSGELGSIEHVVPIFAICFERAPPQPSALDCLQPARRDDHVRVDVLQAERIGPAFTLTTRFHQSVSGVSPLGIGPGCWGWFFLSLR